VLPIQALNVACIALSVRYASIGDRPFECAYETSISNDERISGQLQETAIRGGSISLILRAQIWNTATGKATFIAQKGLRENEFRDDRNVFGADDGAQPLPI
jgi:hypothetical protein